MFGKRIVNIWREDKKILEMRLKCLEEGGRIGMFWINPQRGVPGVPMDPIWLLPRCLNTLYVSLLHAKLIIFHYTR